MPNVIDRSAFQDPCDFDSVPNGVEWLLFFLLLLQRKASLNWEEKPLQKTRKKEEKSFHISKVGLLYRSSTLDVVYVISESTAVWAIKVDL